MPVSTNTGFSFIEQYRSMAKDLEQQSCEDVLTLDQEVPSNKFFYEDLDIKAELKAEPYNGVYSELDMENFVLTNLCDPITNPKSYDHFFGNSVLKRSPAPSNRCSPALPEPSSSSLASLTTSAATVVSNSSQLTSSVSLPTLSPFAVTTSSSSPLPFPSVNSNLTSSRTSTYVTELAGSGCTMVSNPILPDFLLSDPDDNPVYTELTKQSGPLFSGYDSGSSVDSKMDILSEDCNSEPLVQAFYFIGEIQNECDSIGVPYNPISWTSEHVKRWVNTVCLKNRLTDVTSQFCQLDGRALCSLTSSDLNSALGEVGVKISRELDLVKTASSFYSNQVPNAQLDEIPALHEHFLEPVHPGFDFPGSPAPSTDSNSHDSNVSVPHWDHSDDESGYGSQRSSSSKCPETKSPVPVKTTSGRGHKQTIHLWQFLRELLLSKETSYADCIRWLDRKSGIFKIEDSKRVASLWGARKNRPAMNYDKLSRSVRQYYKKGIIKKTEQSKRLVYQFCPDYL